MARKAAITPAEESAGAYFPSKDLEFFSSGCTLLDLVLGGGYPLGKVSNVVGNRSTNKTGFAIEACANFIRAYPEGKIHYVETEAAFDGEYAVSLGFPMDKVTMEEEIFTVEDLFEFLEKLIESNTDNAPRLCIVDSLDALSDDAELKREIRDGSYGGSKAKKLSELFRRLNKLLHTKRTHIQFISQIRDKIGVVYGNKQDRTGGKALDFYASQVIWLNETAKIKRTYQKVERVIGIDVDVKCRKNKVGMPFRSAEVALLFNYGIDDEQSSLKWLKSNGKLDNAILEGWLEGVKLARKEQNRAQIEDLHNQISAAVKQRWAEIDEAMKPDGPKYI